MGKVCLKDLIDYIHSLDIKEYDYRVVFDIHNKFRIQTNYSIFSNKENIVLRFTIRTARPLYGFTSKSARLSINKDGIEIFIGKDLYTFCNGYENTLIVLEHGRDVLKLFETESEIYFSWKDNIL